MNNKSLELKIEDREERKDRMKTNKNVDEEQYRLVISKETNETLENLVGRANYGFDGGMVTKSDVATILIENAKKNFGESEIKSLRALHFDEKKVLKNLLRKSESSGELPEEIKKAIREHYGFDSKERKTSKKLPHTESKESFLTEISTDLQAVRKTPNSNS